MILVFVLAGLAAMLAAPIAWAFVLMPFVEKNASPWYILAGIVLLLLIGLVCIGSPIKCLDEHRPKIREFGPHRLKEQGKRPTMRDPIIIEWQGCLYRCQLIEPSKAGANGQIGALEASSKEE